MGERIIRGSGIDIATEAFGDPVQPPVLLIMGAMASMLWWPDGFCERLAGYGRYVIRYDNRDTGRSTKYPSGEPPYTLDNMADDATHVLDGYGIPAAHIVGMSLGGAIGQLVALKHPARTRSLTAVSTWPIGIDTSHLPGMTEDYAEHAAAGAEVDWSNRAQVIDYMVRDSRMVAGTARSFDETAARVFIERDYERSDRFLSVTNHFMVTGGDAWPDRLHEMKAPLLVIHGTADPIVPVEHGATLAQAIPGTKLVRLEGGGHELHEADWSMIIQAIVEHTQTSAARTTSS